MRIYTVLFSLLFALPCLAQTTCFTDPLGTTICSTPGGVIHGNTSSIGQSIYRDDRGQLLDYEVDQFGNASVQRPTGEIIDWSQSVPGYRENLLRNGSSPVQRIPANPGSKVHHVPPFDGLPGQP